MVPAISSVSLPTVQVSERLPAVPAADVYARPAAADPTAIPIAVQLDQQRSNGTTKTGSTDRRTTAGQQAAVQDVSLPPRRRAQDAAQAPGFPASPYVAQLLAQQAFPPTPTAPEDGLAAYQATIARNSANTSHALSLQA